MIKEEKLQISIIHKGPQVKHTGRLCIENQKIPPRYVINRTITVRNEIYGNEAKNKGLSNKDDLRKGR